MSSLGGRMQALGATYMRCYLTGRASVAVLAVCAGLFAAPALSRSAPVAPDTPPPPAVPASDEAERNALGEAFAQIMNTKINTTEAVKAKVLNHLNSGGAWTALTDIRPQWKQTLSTTASAEIEADLPLAAHLLGRAYAKRMTLGELKAGMAFLNTPAGEDLMRYVADEQAGRTPEPLSDSTRKELARQRLNTEWADFFDKLAHPGPEIAAATLAFEELFTAGLLTRFGVQAEADEAAAFSAHGPDTPQELEAIAIIHLVFIAEGFDKQLARNSTSDADQMNLFPEWPELYRQAGRESVAVHSVEIEHLIGRTAAKGFTAGELKAGLAFFRTPAGQYYIKHAVAVGAGKTFVIPPPHADVVRRFEATATGRSFMTKFHHLESLTAGSKDDVNAVIIAGLFRRFGEKATALAKSRPQL